MSSRTPLILAILLATAGSALAQPGAACMEPVVPPPVDGAKIDPTQFVAAIAAAKAFIAQSDLFQTCVTDELEAEKAAAVQNQAPFDPAMADAAMARVDASQKAKFKVNANINTAMDLYKKAHAQ